LLKFKRKAKDPKPEIEEGIVTFSMWLMYLNILKVVYWDIKEKRGLCLNRLQYLIF